MDALIEKSTRIGLGYATHSDAFQCGREAAQAAKGQLSDGPASLVLIVGPGTVHFKDFVEGARLVLGEEGLLAIPTDHPLSSETTLANASFVAALQLPRMKVSIASDDTDGQNLLRGTTGLISHFRRQRGNAAREFGHRGCLIFSHQLQAADKSFASLLGSDLGLETWMVGASTSVPLGTPLVCTNKSLHHGLAGVEFLSSKPWGVGSIEISPFMTKTDVVQEALKTALRDAMGQMQSHPAAFGLVLFDLSNELMGPLPNDILSNAAAVVSNAPLLGLSTTSNFVRRPQRSIPKQNDSILVLLVPA